MKILLFTLEYPPFKGGVSKVYENIVKYYPEQDNIFVLHNNDGKLINNKLPFLKWLPAVWQLWRAINTPLQKGGEGGYHILVGQILPLGTVAYFVSKFIKIKYTIILHGMDFTFALKSARKKWLTKRILNKAENIICMNNYVAGLVKEFVADEKRGKVEVVNPGVESHITHNIKHITNLKEEFDLENKIVLFSMGRLVKRKGVDMVLKSLPEVLKVAPNLVYVIGGAGADEEYLKNLAQNTPLQKGGRGVIFLGKISDEEKWTWLELADIFTMPSRQIGDDFEGFGIVYLEASLAGKPIVAGRSGGVEDTVIDNETGLLVNPEDTKEIADAIIKLANNEGLRKSLGEAGKKRAEEEFDWEKKIKNIYSIIKSPLY